MIFFTAAFLIYMHTLLPTTCGFISPLFYHRRLPFALEMGKGFQSAKSKQAALAKKMQQAKQQQEQQQQQQPNNTEDLVDETLEVNSNDGNEMRAEFSKLLANNLPPPETPQKAAQPRPVRQQPKKEPSMPGPKVKARDLKKKRKRQKAERAANDQDQIKEVELHEGDKARRIDFEKLIHPLSLQPLGPIEAAKLVPWVPPFLTDWLIIVADPRRQSNDLRATVQYLVEASSSSTCALGDDGHQIMAVTADETSELAAWKNRAEIGDEVPMFVDTSLEWIKTYACVDQDQWSTHVLIIDNDGIIRKHCDKVNPSFATGIVTEILREIGDSNKRR